VDELEYSLKLKKYDIINSAVQMIIKWGSLVAIAWFASGALKSLAGRHTLANVALSFVANLGIGQKVSYVLAVAGIVYGQRQNRLRRRSIERLSARNQELERRLDPGRTSSELPPRGTTKPEDKSLE
jgi:hypothetical protein